MILLVKASVVIAILLTFYIFFLERESFFKANRIYLIGCLVLTFLLPFIALPKLVNNQGIVTTLIEQTEQNESQIIQTEVKKPLVLNEVINTNDTQQSSSVTEVISSTQKRSLMDWVLLFYYFGVVIFSLNLLLQILNILLKAFRSTDKIYDTDNIIINTNSVKEPCSFLNYIFINPESYDFDTYEQIIAHEKIHVKKRHSLDLLLSEIAVIILWFNPFIWLFRKEIEKNIEYQTDELLLSENTYQKDQYQMNLLNIATHNKPLTITTNYNQSILKQRIMKMNSKKSNPHNYWKYSFIAPLFFAILLLLNKPQLALAHTTTNTPILLNKDVLHDDNLNNSSIPKTKESTSAIQTNPECKKLLEAIRSEDLTKVKELLKTTDVNCVDPHPGYDERIVNGNIWKIEKAKAPLFAAARIGNLQIGKLLVAAGATITLHVQGDGTPFITAAQYGQLDFMKYLLDNGAELDRYFPNQGTALIAAANNGQTKAIQFLLSRGSQIGFHSPNQGNALIAAANNGHVETVKFLLSKGAEINVISPNQGNALIAAANNGHVETVKFLLSKGAKIDVISPNQGNALIAAANNGHSETVKLLLDKGSNINEMTRNQGSALIAASNNGHHNTVELLLLNGVNINAKNNGHGTALNAAARNGHSKTIELLLSKGAAINAQNNGQGSALNAAARNGHTHAIELLLLKGVAINAQTNGQGSAINAAARNGHLEAVKLLISKGSDINLQNDGQGSALNAAARNGHLAVVKLLISKGAAINLRSDGQGSALNAASKNNHKEVVEYLLEQGAKY